MNTALLEYEMKKNGYDVNRFCIELGISVSAFYRKKSGKSEFTQGEISKIIKMLNLTSPVEIFFSEQVS